MAAVYRERGVLSGTPRGCCGSVVVQYSSADMPSAPSHESRGPTGCETDVDGDRTVP